MSVLGRGACGRHELGWSLGWAGLQRTEVSEGVTETSSAMAWAPSTPSSQLIMPMLTMLLPFMAAMSSSDAAWLKLLMLTSICAHKCNWSEIAWAGVQDGLDFSVPTLWMLRRLP